MCLTCMWVESWIYPALQECIVYLCGTKVDLVEENKKARKVDVHMVRGYAEGQCYYTLCI